ncbi:hypothetical protein OESDEN_23862 [Oesophagostomum dentatum]|uniref:glutathione transferase n=1 Tax=Oesophagostomum dentatum TaxID=61180 RepID=A0A0B1RTV4_OESDE|nr:hypothetical protein OESDEN_23862 [Oesophagostomum dentatum]
MLHCTVPEMPFEQLPVLEVDGKRIAQSYAICRFLARRFGFAGQDAFEEAVVDSIVDQFRDYLFETRPFLVSLIGVGGGDKEVLKNALFLPQRAKLFGYMRKFLRENPPVSYLVGDSLTWADLCLSEHVATYSEMFPEMLEGYPEVRQKSIFFSEYYTLSWKYRQLLRYFFNRFYWT